MPVPSTATQADRTGSFRTRKHKKGKTVKNAKKKELNDQIREETELYNENEYGGEFYSFRKTVTCKIQTVPSIAIPAQNGNMQVHQRIGIVHQVTMTNRHQG